MNEKYPVIPENDLGTIPVEKIYKEKHPDAIEDVALAFDLATGTNFLEKSMRDTAQKAIELAQKGDEKEAKELLDAIRSTKDEIARRAELISSIYQEAKSIIESK